MWIWISSYWNHKIKNIFIKNSLPRGPQAENQCVYHYTCNERQCNLPYIEYTLFFTKQRFSTDAKNGLIKNHILEWHPAQRVTTMKYLNDVSIKCSYNNEENFVIGQALYIPLLRPKINTQSKFGYGMLNLFRHIKWWRPQAFVISKLSSDS